MNNSFFKKQYKIIDIKDKKNNKTRIDDRYPQRIGSIVNFYLKPLVGSSCCINYLFDNQGEEKSGTLITSIVTNISSNKNEIIIDTLNSIYILKEVGEIYD